MEHAKGYPLSDTELDQQANEYGREKAKSNEPDEFREALQTYRPINLPLKY